MEFRNSDQIVIKFLQNGQIFKFQSHSKYILQFTNLTFLQFSWEKIPPPSVPPCVPSKYRCFKFLLFPRMFETARVQCEYLILKCHFLFCFFLMQFLRFGPGPECLHVFYKFVLCYFFQFSKSVI